VSSYLQLGADIDLRAGGESSALGEGAVETNEAQYCEGAGPAMTAVINVQQ
jgi:hypothetical protein